MLASQRSRSQFLFGLFLQESDLHIGNVTLNDVDWIDRRSHTGLIIGNKEYWRRGIAFEAWSLLLEYAFKQLGLRKVTAGAIEGHDASLAVLRKLGFREEGLFKQEVWAAGSHRDVHRMAIFADSVVEPPKTA